MKKVFYPLLLLLSVIATSQTSATRDPQFQVDYESFLAAPYSSIAITKYDSPTVKDQLLVLRTTAKKCDSNGNVTLKFSNGRTVDIKNAAITCDAYSGKAYNFSASIPFTDAFAATLELDKITSFSIDGVEVPAVFKEKYENLQTLYNLSNQKQ